MIPHSFQEWVRNEPGTKLESTGSVPGCLYAGARIARYVPVIGSDQEEDLRTATETLAASPTRASTAGRSNAAVAARKRRDEHDSPPSPQRRVDRRIRLEHRNRMDNAAVPARLAPPPRPHLDRLAASMTRDEQTNAITEHRLAARRNVVNPDAIRGYIKGDLAKLSAAEINTEWHKITGVAKEARPQQAKAYGTTELDLATSDALVLLAKPYLDHAAIASLLTADYDASTAGRALALALEQHEKPAAEPTGVSLADYLRDTA